DDPRHGAFICYDFFFFFSSRRRHTRSYGDWSSDVCSSDLIMARDGWRAMMHRRLSRAIRQPEAHREMKGTSLSRRALEPDPAPHHLNQTGRDGESQPRAAIVPRCRGIDLPERREDGRLLLRRNPDSGVTHREIAT